MKFGRKKNRRLERTSDNVDRNAPRRRPSSSGVPTKYDRPNTSYSYYNSRSTNRVNVGRVETKARPSSGHNRLRWLWRHSLIIVSSLVIIFCVISELIVSPNVQVSILAKTSQTSLVTSGGTSQYIAAANKLIRASLANKNKLTIDTSGISNSMKKQFPELSSVSVVLPFLGNRPKVYVQVYRPAFALKTKHGIFVVNRSGKAIANTTEQAAKQLKVPVVTDDSDLVAEVGAQVLSSDDGAFIDYTDSELTSAHFKISKIVLAASRELDVYCAGKPYFIKFNLERGNPRQQVGAFIAVAHQLAEQGKTPKQYIDVRLDGRAYYK